MRVAKAGPGNGMRSASTGGNPNVRANSRTPSLRSVASGSRTW